MGCGPAVYVPQAEIEAEALAGLTSLLNACADADGFARKVNEELRRIWSDSVGYDPTVPHKLKDIDAKIANIRKAVENGLPDGDWAFSRMRELISERDALAGQVSLEGEAPQIDTKTALAYRTLVGKIMATGTYAEKKRLIRSCVDHIALTPDTLEVEINYKIPGAIGALNGSGEGI